MDILIKIDNNLCNRCFVCTKECPVKAFKVTSEESAPEIINSRCIGCGKCIEACKPGAITFRNSEEETLKLLSGKNKVACILSPAFAGEFQDVTDFRKLVQMIRSLGFTYVIEDSFGVDLVAFKYLELFKNFKGRYYITANDPVVVQYIEKFKPRLINNLAPIVSPMIASAMVARKKYGNDLKIIYIGPDIARKDEALNYKDDKKIDVVLTFVELRNLFKRKGITESTLEFSKFDPPQGFKGGLYPIVNGFVQAAEMDENLLTTKIISLEGPLRMMEAIEEFDIGVDAIQKHINVSFGNTLQGSGTTNKQKYLTKKSLVLNYASQQLKNFFRFEWNKEINTYASLDFSRTFKPQSKALEQPSKAKVDKILKELNRESDEKISCNECGYASCRDFAVAVAQELTVPEMCTYYVREQKVKYKNQFDEVRTKLERTEKAFQDSEKKFKKEQESAQYASELTNAVVQKLRAGIVIADDKLNILQSNQSFIKIMGDEAKDINDIIPGMVGASLDKLFPPNLYNLFKFVLDSGENVENRDIKIEDNLLNVFIFTIKKHKIIGAIIRDMSSPEVQKAEVMQRVSDVIEKNLEMVQKIGFLLGEGASEIEKELNSIIEFYKTGKK